MNINEMVWELKTKKLRKEMKKLTCTEVTKFKFGRARSKIDKQGQDCLDKYWREKNNINPAPSS